MLEIRGIHAGYGSQQVLFGVDLKLPTAKVVALLGPNGAGKSTLLRVASGVLSPTAGAVLFDGSNVTRRNAYERARQEMRYIPEGRGLFPNLTVRENIRLQSPRGLEREALEFVCDSFPVLRQKLNALAGNLSGGQQRMLALAAAHAARPRVMLIDELSLGLAPVVIDEVYEHLRKLVADGAAILLVEQYYERALDFADLVYVLSKGRIVWSGPAVDVAGDELVKTYLGHTTNGGMSQVETAQSPRPGPVAGRRHGLRSSSTGKRRQA